MGYRMVCMAGGYEIVGSLLPSAKDEIFFMKKAQFLLYRLFSCFTAFVFTLILTGLILSPSELESQK
jgi:hypothetical protein